MKKLMHDKDNNSHTYLYCKEKLKAPENEKQYEESFSLIAKKNCFIKLCLKSAKSNEKTFIVQHQISSMNLSRFSLFNLTILHSYFVPFDIKKFPLNFADIVVDFVQSIGNISENVSAYALCPIHFTELQTILLTIFLVILSINLALIGFYWQKYGGVITDRFIRPSKYFR